MGGDSEPVWPCPDNGYFTIEAGTCPKHCFLRREMANGGRGLLFSPGGDAEQHRLVDARWRRDRQK
jgi:hypothetical protein